MDQTKSILEMVADFCKEIDGGAEGATVSAAKDEGDNAPVSGDEIQEGE